MAARGPAGREGRIRIAGFYENVRPLTEAERRALDEVPEADRDLREALDLAKTEGGGERLVERILKPALNIRGLRSGHVGEQATNAIPTEATASIDFRLVPDQTPEEVRSRVEAHLQQQGYFIVGEPPDRPTRQKHARIVKLRWEPGYPAARTSMDLPASRAVVSALESAGSPPIVRLPSLGGSVPMYLFSERLKAPAIGLAVVNHDNNQHAANENLRLQNLWDAIELYASLLARLGAVWPAK